MLEGVHPLLTGELLMHLDRMGHSDAVIIADAHFPAWGIGHRTIDVPGVTTPALLEAVRTVIPLDDAPPIDLMASADGEVLDVQRELADSARIDVSAARFLGRFDFYDAARSAYLIVRCGETRTYANVLLRKGVVGLVSPEEVSAGR